MNPGTSFAPRLAGRTVLYRGIALALSVSFAVVGVLFLVIPGSILSFFDGLSEGLGLAAGHEKPGFFLVLAVAYMYLVSLLAFQMFRSPGVRIYPVLLMNAKFASAFLSALFFFIDAPLLVYLVNAVVDGAIGCIALALTMLQRSFPK